MTESVKTGRPTTYKKEFIALAQEYLTKSIDALDLIVNQEVEVIKGNGEDNNYTETKITKIGRLNVKLPSIEGLAKHIKVSRSNIYKWRNEHPAFSDILEEILEEQAERLINMGLAGTYNGTITKLLLAKHGYIEKQEIDQTTKVINYTPEQWAEMTPEQLEKVANGEKVDL